MKPSSRYWEDLSTAEFTGLDMERVVALLPVAAIEQHGPHLPVRVDAAINAGIVDRALEMLGPDAQVLVLPGQWVGKSNEHNAFPGTLSISWEALGRAWFDIGESVGRAGCRRIVFFNSHGGQPQLIDIVCRDLRVKLSMFAVACSWFATIDMADLFDETERVHGIHGGAIETSMMLHLHPDLVDMSVAADFVPHSIAIAAENEILRSEGKTGFGWQTQDLHPSGAAGNAAAATPELGKELVERAARALATLLGEVERYPLSRITADTAYSTVTPSTTAATRGGPRPSPRSTR